MSKTATGTFDVTVIPAAAELDGAVGRFDSAKAFHGDLAATGAGVMLSCGDPQSREAGYVAIETVNGRLDGRPGGFALQQLGMMSGGSQTLHYEIVPGSGQGELEGISGTMHLTIEDDGTHRYELSYDM